jgi:hypothetical protein
MTPITPITQPPHESLANALQIADLWSDAAGDLHSRGAFGDVARLIRDALDKLGEPHPVTLAVTSRMRRLYDPTHPMDVEREVRDMAAAITRAALTWEGTPR